MRKIYYIIQLLFFLDAAKLFAQPANHIANGSFEELYDCNFPYHLRKVKHWLSIDSIYAGAFHQSFCSQTIPLNGNTYQYPKTGDVYMLTTLYGPSPISGRGYLKNRLKQNLQAGKTYCVKFHVNICNTSPRGMDGFGIYFGDGTIDTITKCTIPLRFINPQVKNPLGNVISDTLNWVPITGTFVANGAEKYALIGNFLADNAVTTASINTPAYPGNWTDVCIDDVSCIEMDVPAFAGPDQAFNLGDSVFIGREPDFAIDEGCVWYELPNAIPIATISGLWVKPAVTTTYVVRQELECSSLKWDTVVVYRSTVGFAELIIKNEELKIYPIPADDVLALRLDASTGAAEKLFEYFNRLSIYNSLGQVLRTEELNFKEKTLSIGIRDLDAGVYFLTIKNNNAQTMPSGTQSTLRQASFGKRFIIQR